MSTNGELFATEGCTPLNERPHVVYRAYDEDDVLLYVGMTVKIALRLEDHRKTKDWWPSVATIKYEHHASRDEAAEAERLAIMNENPVHNIYTPNKPLPRTQVAFPEEAVNDLLGDRRTGDNKEDILAAAAAFVIRQRQILLQGGALVRAMKNELGLSYREIEVRTGVSKTTAQRWVRLSHGVVE